MSHLKTSDFLFLLYISNYYRFFFYFSHFSLYIFSLFALYLFPSFVRLPIAYNSKVYFNQRMLSIIYFNQALQWFCVHFNTLKNSRQETFLPPDWGHWDYGMQQFSPTLWTNRFKNKRVSNNMEKKVSSRKELLTRFEVGNMKFEFSPNVVF